jgi:hypothetical protein
MPGLHLAIIGYNRPDIINTVIQSRGYPGFFILLPAYCIEKVNNSSLTP